MAKKKELNATDFDIFDDGLGLDFGDFDFDVQDPPDDRHPAIKAASLAGKGVRSYASEKKNIERFVKASLPRGYGQLYEFAGENLSELSALYNSAKAELAPVRNAAKSVIGKALPTVGSRLPKSLRDKLEAFSKEETSQVGYRESGQEEKLAGLLSEVFGQQQEQRVSDREEYIQKENLRQGFEQVRHNDSMGQLNAIRLAAEAQSKYNSTIGFNYQKKSLELGYRSFWALTELVKTQKESNAAIINELKTAVKNTALPDFAKITPTESMAQIVRNKFLESARERMFGGAGSFFKRMAGNLQKQTQTALSSFGAAAENISSAGSLMGGDTMPPGMRNELIASMLMEIPLNYVSNKASNAIRARTANNRALKRGDAQARNFIGSASDRVRDALSDPSNSWGPLEGLREFLRNAAPSDGGDTRLEKDNVMRQNEAYPYTRQTHKSLNEIIPGMLARIHREIKILRTGDESTGLLAYDFAKNKFSTTKEISEGLKRNLAVSNGGMFKEGIAEIISKVDRGGKLTEAQRERAMRMIGERAINGGSLDASRVASSVDWGGGDDGQAIAAAFSRYLRIGADGKISKAANAAERQIDLGGRFNSLTSGLSDPRAELQTLVNSGQLEMLRESGLLGEGDEVSRTEILNILMGESGKNGRVKSSRQRGGYKGVRRQKQSTGFTGSEALGELAQSSAHSIEILQEIRDKISSQPSNPTDIINNGALAVTVRSIDDRIAQLVELYSSQSNAQVGIAAAMANHAGVDLSQMSSFEMTGRGLAGVGSGFVKSQINLGKGIFNRFIRPGFNKVNDAVTATARFFKSKATNTYSRVRGVVGDVYVSGEFSPRIKKSVMEAGGYFDSVTKKAIKSLDEIKGDVLDANGNIVITLSEFKDSFVGGGLNKPVRSLFGAVFSSITNTANRVQGLLTNTIPNVMRTGFKVAIGLAKGLRNMAPPYDVYVKGSMDEPVLFANAMKFGRYKSAVSDKLVKHPRDIDGPVLDSDGNYILTDEQIKQGLVDASGRPINTSAITLIAGAGIAAVTKTIGRLKKLGTNSLGVLASTMSRFGGFFKDLFTPLAVFETRSKETNVWLEKIHDMLDERLPGRKVFGDTTGDGIRDGSLADLMRKREAAKKDEDRKKKEGGEKTGTKSMLSRILGGLSGLGSFLPWGKKDKEDGGKDGGYGLSDAADAASIYDALRGRGKSAGGAASKAGKAGLFRRAGSFIARNAVTTSLLTGAGTALSAAGSAAASVGGAALAGAKLAGGALAAMAGTITLPAVALAGGVAALGVGGYMLYKYLKRTKPTKLSNLRLVQYGVMPDDKEGATKLWELESLLEKAVVQSDGKVGLDKSKIDQKEIVKLMQLQRGDAQIFNEYFNNRFIPVFIHWIRALRSVASDASLSNAESVFPKKEKWKIASDAVRACSQVYAMRAGWATNHSRLSAGPNEVGDYLSSIRIDLMKEGEKEGGEKATTLEKTLEATSLTSASAAAAAAMKDQNSYKVTDKNGNEVDVNTLKHEELTKMVRDGEAMIQVKLNVPKALLHNRSNNQLDALTSVRMKAYGLREMTLNKVQQLGALERYMMDNMEGDPSSSTAGIKPEKVLREVGEVFGVNDADEVHKNRFRYWFNGRFLPVFLTYAAGVRKKTSKKDLDEGVKTLSLGDQLTLARAIVAVIGRGPTGGNFSVWNIPSNPWKEEYVLNDNPDTTAGNIEAMRQLADKVALGEVTARVGANTESDQRKAAFGSTKQPLARRDQNGRALGAQASGDKIVDMGADTVSGKAAATFSASGKGLVFGSPTGGAYNAIPDASGSGWGGLKNTIVGAAKATGVDAETLAMIIAQESSFNPSATPRGYPSPSGAKGLGQHLPSSWAEDMKLHGAELGIPSDTSPFDPKAAALLTAMRLRRNGMRLQKLLGRPVKPAEVYMAHLMGADGAESVLSMGGGALSMNSEKGSNAKKQHPEYFLDPKTRKPRTVAETVDFITGRLTSKLNEFGVTASDLQGGAMSESNNPALAAAMSTTIPDSQEKVETLRKSNGVLPTNTPRQVIARQHSAAGGAVRGGTYAGSVRNLTVPSSVDFSKQADTTPRNPIPDTPGGVTLFLDREESHEDGTYGVLRLPNGSSYMTLELPWRDNKPQISCIPPGTYKMRRRQTTRFGFAFEILGVEGRSGILVHGGTYAGSKDKEQKANSQGCVLLGTRRGHNGKQKMITGYKEAMSSFYDSMGNHTQCTIVIKGPTNMEGASAASPQAEVDIASIRANAPVPITENTSQPQASPSQAAPVAAEPAMQLPRLSTPRVELNRSVAQTPQSMQQRDKALTEVISPKIDTMNSTLASQLLELRKIVTLLEGGGSTKAQAPAKIDNAVLKPNTTSVASIPQRRSV